jgi:hypothetical protein
MTVAAVTLQSNIRGSPTSKPPKICELSLIWKREKYGLPLSYGRYKNRRMYFTAISPVVTALISY